MFATQTSQTSTSKINKKPVPFSEWQHPSLLVKFGEPIRVNFKEIYFQILFYLFIAALSFYFGNYPSNARDLFETVLPKLQAENILFYTGNCISILSIAISFVSLLYLIPSTPMPPLSLTDQQKRLLGLYGSVPTEIESIPSSLEEKKLVPETTATSKPSTPTISLYSNSQSPHLTALKTESSPIPSSFASDGFLSTLNSPGTSFVSSVPLTSLDSSFSSSMTDSNVISPSMSSRQMLISSPSSSPSGRSVLFSTSPTSSSLRPRSSLQSLTSIPDTTMKDEELMHEKSLETLVSNQESRDSLRSRIDASFALAVIDPPPNLPTYQPTNRSSPRTLTSGRTTSQSKDLDYSNVLAAQELLEKLNISEDLLEEWTGRMRLWIVNYILKPLSKRIEMMESMGFNRNLFVPFSSVATSQSVPSMFMLAPSQQSTLPKDLGSSLLYPRMASTISSETMDPLLGNVMKVLEISQREYLVQRIKELAAGNCMANFKWNTSAKPMEKEKAAELPTDAKIIILLFCAFMDLKLPKQPLFEEKPFSSKHFIASTDKPDASGRSVVIFERSVQPPHFQIESSNPNETWPVEQGRNNLFHTLILFIYCVKIKFSGYLDQISLENKDIQLLSVIS